MKNIYVMANFKMNKTDEEVKNYFDKFLIEDKKVKIVLAPPFTSLKTAVELSKPSGILIAAQNVNENEKGAFTGEISAQMLSGLGVGAVIIGHSERRILFNETNEIVNKKILKALKSGLVCIFCVGESLYDRKNQLVEQVLQKQVIEGLKSIYGNELKNIVIAYEPVWAIGTGVTPTDTEIVDAIKVVRKVLSGIYDEQIAQEVVIAYGGSVNENNCKEIARLDGVDGALVGGASLDETKFKKIVEAFAFKKKK